MINRSCPLCEGKEHKELNYYVREFIDRGPKAVECKKCGFIFLNPIMDQLEYKKFYDKDGQKKFVDSLVREDYRGKLHNQSYRVRLLEEYLTKNARVIDVGCGYSYFLDSICGQVSSADGIEPSAVRASVKRNGVSVLNGYIEDWPDDNSADLITTFHVLEHVVDLDSFIVNVRRILDKDGRFVIEVPNHDDLLVNLNKYKWFYYQNAHCSYFNTRTLLLLLEKFGFTIEKHIKLQRYSISNHLHWLFFGKPGIIKSISFLDGVWAKLVKIFNKHDTIFLVAKKKNSY